MELGYSGLTALTPSNSGVTQYTTGYTGSTFVTVDGYQVATQVTGVTYDISVVSMYDLGGGNYSGTAHTFLLNYFSADTINYTGRTIWVDVSGITRTQDLILSKNPIPNYVWTCSDSEGLGSWQAISGVSASTLIWSGSSGSPSAVLVNSSSVASGNYSVAEGNLSTASGAYSHAEGVLCVASANFAHAEGNLSTASGSTSHAEGSRTIAGGSYSHAEGYNTKATGQSSHAQGNLTIAIGSNSHAGGNQSTASGTTSFVHGVNSTAGGSATIVLGSGITGTTDNTTYVNKLNITTLDVYADNTAATSAGLEVGTVYRTSTGQLMVRY
jgi:hypothetical protein